MMGGGMMDRPMYKNGGKTLKAVPKAKKNHQENYQKKLEIKWAL